MNNITELVFILDASGSMAGMESDTVGGFNAMIGKQKKADGTAYVSTLLFSSGTTVIHDRADIQSVAPMTAGDYTVGGCTALLDAVGGAIHHIGSIHRYARPEDVPAHTVFVITTDGMENASHRYTAPQVKSMISRCKEEKHWEFLFLGANIDAVTAAGEIGIDRGHAVNYHCDSGGTAVTFRAVDSAIRSVRATGSAGTQWRRDADSDFAGRQIKKKQ